MATVASVKSCSKIVIARESALSKTREYGLTPIENVTIREYGSRVEVPTEEGLTLIYWYSGYGSPENPLLLEMKVAGYKINTNGILKIEKE